jgi:hypothetical protein
MAEHDPIDEQLSDAFERALGEAARTSWSSVAGPDLAGRARRHRREQIVGALALAVALGGAVVGVRTVAGPGATGGVRMTVVTTAPAASANLTSTSTSTTPITIMAGGAAATSSTSTTWTSTSTTTVSPQTTTSLAPAPAPANPVPRRGTFLPTTTLPACPDNPGPTDPCIAAASPPPGG